MMPEGMLQKLSAEEVRDLLAYLRGPDQVPLPGNVDKPEGLHSWLVSGHGW